MKTKVEGIEGLIEYQSNTNYYKQIGVIGMSPGNSYFKKEAIESIIEKCSLKFSDIIIMIPNIPAIYTYKALGYSDKEAQRKARLKSNALINRINCVLPKIQEKYLGQITVFNWGEYLPLDFECSLEYSKLLELYNVCEEFREDVRETTRAVIKPKVNQNLNIEKSVDIGINYLLYELAFMSKLSKTHSSDITYVYHVSWPIYEKYISGVYDKIHPNLKFLIID